MKRISPKHKVKVPLLTSRKRYCRFCKEAKKSIDYKDIKILEKLITERGRILSTKISGTCSKHQRKVAKAIKHARFLGLLPYIRY